MRGWELTNRCRLQGETLGLGDFISRCRIVRLDAQRRRKRCASAGSVDAQEALREAELFGDGLVAP